MKTLLKTLLFSLLACGSMTQAQTPRTMLKTPPDGSGGGNEVLESFATGANKLTISATGTLEFKSGFTLTGASYLRTAAGLAIGTNVQAYDADLTTYAGITPSANVQSLLGAADYAAMRTQFGLVIGTNVQAYSANLTTYAGITPSANVQSLLGASNYSAMRTQLGLVIGTNVQAYNANLTTYAGITPSANVQSLLGAADYGAMRTQLGLVIGTNVQAYNANLTTYAGITPSANVQTLLGSANYAAFSASLGLGTMSTQSASAVTITGGSGVFSGGLQGHIGNSDGVVIGTSAGGSYSTNTSDQIAIGFFAGAASTTTDSAQAVRIGRHAGYAALGAEQVCIGHAAGQYAYDSANSVNIGYLAGRNATQTTPQHSFGSVIIGYEAVTNGISAQTGVFIGQQAGRDITTSVGAVMLGYNAGASATNSDTSVIIGYNAGHSATNATSSVLIGARAGYSLNRSNSLVIESNATYTDAGNTGLIYGEFDNRLLTFNAATTNLAPLSAGIVNVGGGSTASEMHFLEPSGSGTNYTGFKAQAQSGNVTYTLPAADGTSGQALTTNGSAVLAWGTVGGGGGITIGTTTSNGTAGRVLYTDGTNVQQYAVTGSGSAVLNTSPSLVTPILGTPTSGTLTNCTGLPVSSGVSGLGTSVATWLASGTKSALDTLLGVTLLQSGGGLGTPSGGTLTNCTGLPPAGVTGTAAVLGANIFTAVQTVSFGIAAATRADGAVLSNTTAATSGNQTYSPSLTLTGNQYASGASRAVSWYATNIPVQQDYSHSILRFQTKYGTGSLTNILDLRDFNNGPFIELGTGAAITIGSSGGSGVTNIQMNGSPVVQVNTNAIYWSKDMLFQWTNSSNVFGTVDVTFGRESAGVLSQKNGTNAQEFRVYGTTTGSKYLSLKHDGTNAIISASSGTLGLSGNIALDKTITAGGNTGAQTINKASGSVNMAAAATSLVVTNSLVTTSSVIICTVGTHDGTCLSVQAVAGSGSFTIYPNAPPTAETVVYFIITN